jgi:hypothetical protein
MIAPQAGHLIEADKLNFIKVSLSFGAPSHPLGAFYLPLLLADCPPDFEDGERQPRHKSCRLHPMRHTHHMSRETFPKSLVLRKKMRIGIAAFPKMRKFQQF